MEDESVDRVRGSGVGGDQERRHVQTTNRIEEVESRELNSSMGV